MLEDKNMRQTASRALGVLLLSLSEGERFPELKPLYEKMMSMRDDAEEFFELFNDIDYKLDADIHLFNVKSLVGLKTTFYDLPEFDCNNPLRCRSSIREVKTHLKYALLVDPRIGRLDTRSLVTYNENYVSVVENVMNYIIKNIFDTKEFREAYSLNFFSKTSEKYVNKANALEKPINDNFLTQGN